MVRRYGRAADGDREPGSASIRLRDTLLGVMLALGILAFNVLYVAAQMGFLHKPHRVLETDHQHYLAMARGEHGDPTLARRPPYCYRILIPGLASLIASRGIRLNTAFFIITNVSLFGLLLTLHLYMRSLGLQLHSRIFGLLLVGLTPGFVRWFEYQYWMTDPACLFLLTLVLCLIRRERWGRFWFVSILAAFVRETYVLVYPYLFIRLLKRLTPLMALVRTAALALLPALILWELREYVPANPHPGLWASIVDNLDFRWRHLFDNGLYMLTLGTWGTILALALLRPERLPDFVRRYPEHAALVFLVYATTFMISNNNERPLSYALPVVLPAALFQVESFLQETRLSAAPVMSLAIALQLLFYLTTRFAGILGISIYQPTNATVTIAITLAWLGAIAVRFHRTRSGRSNRRSESFSTAD